MNFLEETRKAISDANQQITDIEFIGSLETGEACNWVWFEKHADKEYDAGYGAPYVRGDLVIIFKDGGRLARYEYDGDESWEYVKPIRVPSQLKKLSYFFFGIKIS